MALIFDGSANTVANLAVGGLPDGVVDEDTLATNAVSKVKVKDDAIGVDELHATSGAAGTATFFRGDGTWQEAGGGILLQVKDVFESDQVVLSTHNTWTDLDVSVAITPTDGTTKMAIWAHCGGIHVNSTANWIGIRLIGNATGMTEYNKTLETHYGYYTSGGGNVPVQGWRGPVCTHVVHDHNELDTITYKLQAIVYDNSDDEATFMMWGDDNNCSNATIVVQEFST